MSGPFMKGASRWHVKECVYHGCGNTFRTKDKQQRFCSKTCAGKAMSELRRWCAREPQSSELVGDVDAAIERARQQRIARERAAGRRTYTIDPWAQRPGAGSFDPIEHPRATPR